MNASDTALMMIGAGVSVVPVPHGQKFPSIPWKQFQSERASGRTLNEWFTHESGLAVVCGSVSGNLVCLDFDEAGAYGWWSQENFSVSATMPTDRGGRGWHVFFRTPEPVPSGRLYLKGWPGPAGDLLSEGKLAVVPPTVHPNGHAREWLVPWGELPVYTLEEVGVTTVLSEHHATGPQQPRGAGCDRPGDDFNQRATWAEVLEPHGWQRVRDFGGRTEWVRPGKAARDGISAVSGLGNSGQDMLFVFSTNAHPLEPNLCYTKFFVYSILEHGGDTAAAVRCLVQRGYGSGFEVPPFKDKGSWEERGENKHPPGSTPIGEDEWLASGFEKFGAMFKDLPEYLAECSVTEDSWVVEGFLPKTYLVVIGGNSKSGKSCFVTALSVAVAQGEPFLGMSTTQGPVLWCACEESSMERAMTLNEHSLERGIYTTHERIRIDRTEDLEALRWWIRFTGANLVVIDPLYGANEAETLTDGMKARQTLAGLKDLCRQEEVCAIVIHHITKNTASGMVRERFADSNQILATASMDLLMDTTDLDSGIKEIRLQGHGRGAFANQTFIIHSRSVTNYELKVKGAAGTVDSSFKDDQLLEVLAREPMTAEQLAEATGQGLKSVQNRLTGLVKSGKVVRQGKSGKATVYGLPPLMEVSA